MTWLKQNTAVTIKFGPFVDDTDGKTAETALTISQGDIKLSKNGGTLTQTNNAAGATHDALGYYGVPLDTTDTNTLGTLRVVVSESGALPVWQDFMIVPANVYDSLVGGTDNLDVSLVAGQLTVKKNVALANFTFPMYDATGELESGLTVTVSIRKDAGSFAASANSASELGTTGWYTIDLTQAEMNANVIAFSATATGAVPSTYTILTQA